MNVPAFREVTKEEFREVYFRLGGGNSTGWTADYWRKSFEGEGKSGWRYMVEEPRSPAHDRMCIAEDHETKECRLFFMIEQSAEDFFDHPERG
jgi:hypothetical protein